MKKIVFLVIAVFATMATSTVKAQQVTDKEKQEEIRGSKYYQIELGDLPQNVKDAISTSYPNCRIDEVYVSNIAYAKYKVVLLTQDRKKQMVYFDDKGVVLNEHKTFWCLS